MLIKYVSDYEINKFKKYLISFNIHNLIHLVKEVLLQNSPLDYFACWSFESNDVTLKQFGKRQQQYLQQAYNRTIEEHISN